MRKENEKEDFWCEECQMYKPMGYCPEHNKYPEEKFNKKTVKKLKNTIEEAFMDSGYLSYNDDNLAEILEILEGAITNMESNIKRMEAGTFRINETTEDIKRCKKKLKKYVKALNILKTAESFCQC